jgi:hypothetical protein
VHLRLDRFHRGDQGTRFLVRADGRRRLCEIRDRPAAEKRVIRKVGLVEDPARVIVRVRIATVGECGPRSGELDECEPRARAGREKDALDLRGEDLGRGRIPTHRGDRRRGERGSSGPPGLARLTCQGLGFSGGGERERRVRQVNETPRLRDQSLSESPERTHCTQTGSRRGEKRDREIMRPDGLCSSPDQESRIRIRGDCDLRQALEDERALSHGVGECKD